MTAPVLAPDEQLHVDAIGVHDFDILAEMEERVDDELLCCASSEAPHAAEVRAVCRRACGNVCFYCREHLAADRVRAVLGGGVRCIICRLDGPTLDAVMAVTDL